MLKPADYRYFSLQLWQEGVARYTEYHIMRAAAAQPPGRAFRALPDYQLFRQEAERIKREILQELKTLRLTESERTAFYPFGAGEALLLDRANPNWRSRYATERFYLERYFSPPSRH